MVDVDYGYYYKLQVYERQKFSAWVQNDKVCISGGFQKCSEFGKSACYEEIDVLRLIEDKISGEAMFDIQMQRWRNKKKRAESEKVKTDHLEQNESIFQNIDSLSYITSHNNIGEPNSPAAPAHPAIPERPVSNQKHLKKISNPMNFKLFANQKFHRRNVFKTQQELP